MKNKSAIARVGAWVAVALVALLVYDAARGRIGRSAKDANAPYTRFAQSSGGFFSRLCTPFSDRTALRRQNTALAAENEELKAQMLHCKTLTQENAFLRETLRIAPRYPGSIAAEVVSRGGAASGWLKTVRINKGEADGVRRFAPVVNGAGLVGRVIETTHRTADVLLLADPNCKVSCYIEREGIAAHGIAFGGGFGDGLTFVGAAKPLTVDYLGKDIEVREGDKILTSGLGGAYPRGLPIGEVIVSGAAESGLYQTARIAPFADFTTVSLVFVLKSGVNAER